jgi:hypothetical protein
MTRAREQARESPRGYRCKSEDDCRRCLGGWCERFGQRFAADHIVEGGCHLFVATGVGTSIIPVRSRVPLAVNILRLESHGAQIAIK